MILGYKGGEMYRVAIVILFSSISVSGCVLLDGGGSESTDTTQSVELWECEMRDAFWIGPDVIQTKISFNEWVTTRYTEEELRRDRWQFLCSDIYTRFWENEFDEVDCRDQYIFPREEEVLAVDASITPLVTLCEGDRIERHYQIE